MTCSRTRGGELGIVEALAEELAVQAVVHDVPVHQGVDA